MQIISRQTGVPKKTNMWPVQREKKIEADCVGETTEATQFPGTNMEIHTNMRVYYHI